MNSRQRLEAAIALRPVDRPPVAPVLFSFAGRHAGVPMAEFFSSQRAARRALARAFADLGGWDAQVIPGRQDPLLYALVTPVRQVLPGRDLPADSPAQALEVEAMLAEDYGRVVEKGWLRTLVGHVVPRLYPGMGGTPAGLARFLTRALPASWGMYLDDKYWQRRGIPVLVGAAVNVPFDTLTFARSLPAMALDLYDRPEQVIAAMESMLPDLVRASLLLARLRGKAFALLSPCHAPGLVYNTFD